jgi:hypothetical protein
LPRTCRSFRSFAERLLFVLLFSGLRLAAAAHLTYGWQNVEGINLFFREGGPMGVPTLVLLHGNPSSSIMYQELMQRLAEVSTIQALPTGIKAIDSAPMPYQRTLWKLNGR